MLIDNPRGNYRFIRGGGPFSSGCIATEGFEVLHARFLPIVPLARGFELIDRYLAAAGRPLQALCGTHLRIPKPLSQSGFDEFNRPYVEALRSRGLEIDGANPVARTNVAPEAGAVKEATVAGFFFTAPADGARRPTFIVSGSAEVRNSAAGREVVSAGDTSPQGLAHKARCVLEAIAARLAEFGVKWTDASAINIYTAYDIHPLLATTLIPALGSAALCGLTWHYARPPVVGLDLEIDVCATRQTVVLS